MKFRRITVDPRQMDGVPCIRRLRIPVATVVGMVASYAFPEAQRIARLSSTIPPLLSRSVGPLTSTAVKRLRSVSGMLS